MKHFGTDGKVTRSTHVKYESHTSYGSKVMTKAKVFKMWVKDHSYEVKHIGTDGKVLSEGIHSHVKYKSPTSFCLKVMIKIGKGFG